MKGFTTETGVFPTVSHETVVFITSLTFPRSSSDSMSPLGFLFPGISELASSPEKASDYIYPLLSFAALHIPKNKHQETPLYILCTAGMRVLPDR